MKKRFKDADMAYGMTVGSLRDHVLCIYDFKGKRPLRQYELREMAESMQDYLDDSDWVTERLMDVIAAALENRRIKDRPRERGVDEIGELLERKGCE